MTHPDQSLSLQPAAGWVLVPVEPTDEMLFAAELANPRGYRDLFAAMLNAAPKAPDPSVHSVDAPITPLPLEVASPQGSATRLPTYAEGTYRQLDAGLDAAAQRPLAAAAPQSTRPDEPKEVVGDPTALRAALEADAARYRWLRDESMCSGPPPGSRDMVWCVTGEAAYSVNPIEGDELDAHVDAALALPRESGGS